MFFIRTVPATEVCVQCHSQKTPDIVRDWQLSKHAQAEVTCSVRNGKGHEGAKDQHLASLPDEKVCGQCHSKQFGQFIKGKRSLEWKAMTALPVSNLESEELIEGKRGCGGRHNMGIRDEGEGKRLLSKGYRHEINPCDECHTRHLFSKGEACTSLACQKCHMGYDHPQWQMWSSSKHGTRYLAIRSGEIPKEVQAPTCQDCHMPHGNHENHAASGFLAVLLPLPDDPQWAKDRVTILKALGVLDPNTEKPTSGFEAVRVLKLARLTEDEWKGHREKMVANCKKCHSEAFTRKQLGMRDQMLKEANRRMAQAIETVAGLYRDDILKKRNGYIFDYPDLLYLMQNWRSDKGVFLYRASALPNVH